MERNGGQAGWHCRQPWPLVLSLRYFYSDIQCSLQGAQVSGNSKAGRLGNGGSSPRSHSHGGNGSKSDVDILCSQCFFLQETRAGLLSDGFSPCISSPRVSEPGKRGGWSSRSTSFVDLSGSREQHGLAAEGTATSESGFRGGGTPPAGLHELVTCMAFRGGTHGGRLGVLLNLCALGIVVQRPRTALAGRADSFALQGPICQW